MWYDFFMKWYFASRTKHQQKVAELSRFLVKAGEMVLSDWVYAEPLQPYEENMDKALALSREVVKSILNTNIFVLISDPEGTDMFAELGIALAKNEVSHNARIYIVGKHSKRSLMQLHPSIIHVPDIQNIFEKEGIKAEKFNFPNFA